MGVDNGIEILFVALEIAPAADNTPVGSRDAISSKLISNLCIAFALAVDRFNLLLERGLMKQRITEELTIPGCWKNTTCGSSNIETSHLE